MRKRFAGVILFFVMSICYVNTVFATAIGIPIPGVSDAINEMIKKHENFSNKLNEFLGYEASNTEIRNWSLAIATLRADGFSDAAIAGILGNVKVEGGTKQFAIEGYSGKKTTDDKDYTQFELGKSYDYGDVEPSLYTSPKTGKSMGGEGHGLVQWSFGRASNLTRFAENSKFGYVTVTHWHKSYDGDMEQHTCKIPDMAGQVCFMVEELNTDYTDVKEQIKDLDSAWYAAKFFHNGYEKSGTDTLRERQTAANEALPLVEACTAVVSVSEEDEDVEQKVVDNLTSKKIWHEDEFASFSELVEKPLFFATRDDLSQENLKGVVDWKNNIEYESEDNVIKYIRVFVMLFGILFLVWILLIYLSYWFDRINNFLDLELLPIVTAGRLRVSPEEHECTFNPKSYSKGQAQTVNHRTVLFICMVGVFFAVLIISGYIYTLLNYLVRKMLSIIGIV